MALLNEITVDQFKTVLSEFFAEPEKRQKLTHDEIKELAARVNKKVNIPLVREIKEEKILIKAILRIDNFLYNNLPNEIYDLIRSTDQGISDDEAKRLIKRLSNMINKKIDIPYIPEVAEGIAIRFVIAIIINAARKKLNIYTAGEKLQDVDIKNDGEIEDNDAEDMIV